LRGGHKGEASEIAFTADGKGLVTICRDSRVKDRSICHWDLVSGRLLKTVALKLPGRLHRVCLSPDGQTLAVSPRGRDRVFLLDTTTGTERLKLQGKLAEGGYGLAFARDGKTLVTSGVDLQEWGEQTEVAFWDVGTGKLLRHFPIPYWAALCFCLAPDGRTLASAGQEPLVRLWDVGTGKQVHDWPAHTGAIWTLAFTPDGAALVSGSLDGTLRLWDVKSGTHLRQLQGHSRGISGLAVTPDGKTIVSSGSDGSIRLQTLDGKEVRPILLGAPQEKQDSPRDCVFALGMSLDGKTAATYSQRRKPPGTVYHVWDLATGKAVIERQDHVKVISTRTFSPDTRFVLQHVFGGGMADGSGPLTKGGEGSSGGPPASTLAVLEDVAGGERVLALALPEQAGRRPTFRGPEGTMGQETAHRVVVGPGKRGCGESIPGHGPADRGPGTNG
jgi:WD40 repeat protein